MIKDREVLWEDERLKATLVVAAATVEVGIKRSQLIDEVERRPDWKTPMSVQARVIRHLTYSACAAALKSVKIEPKEGVTLEPEELFDENITLEQFLQLPEMLVVVWEQAVIDLNPHWVPRTPKKLDDPNPSGSGGSEITKSTDESSATLKSESTPSMT